MRDKNVYRNLTIQQILALDSETTRDYLETLIREHTDDTLVMAVQIAQTLEQEERDAAIAAAQDEEEYLTEVLDRATDDALAEILAGIIGKGTSNQPR